MKITLYIISAFVLCITITPFVLYAFHLMNEAAKLKDWRKALMKGMTVIINDGRNIYKGKVISVMPGWVRVITDSGNTAGVPNRNIYPLNYVIDERDMHSPGDHLPGERGKTDQEAV